MGCSRDIGLVKEWIAVGRTLRHARGTMAVAGGRWGTAFAALVLATLTARTEFLTRTALTGRAEVFHGADFHIDLLLDELLDIAHIAAVRIGHQGHGQTRCASAAGTADAVHIVFCVERYVEVEHGRHILDVQATRCHIGTHQQIHFTGLEGFQSLQALVLALVAVQGRGTQSVALQRACQACTA